MARRAVRYESKIASFRQAKQLTQRQLAEKIDVSEGTIANWESARRGFDCLVTVARLCQTLEAAPHELYVEIDEAALAVTQGIEALESEDIDGLISLGVEIELMKSKLSDLLRPTSEVSSFLRSWDVIAPIAASRPKALARAEKAKPEEGDEAQQLFELAQKLTVNINKAYEEILATQSEE
jgi:transcriptional regulator with XRE-family HTH domain